MGHRGALRESSACAVATARLQPASVARRYFSPEILASVPMYRGGPADLWAAGVPIHDACLQCGCLYVGFQSLVVALLPRQRVICQEFVAAKYLFRARDASSQLSDCSVFAPQKAECRSCDDAMPRMKQKICDVPLPFAKTWNASQAPCKVC